MAALSAALLLHAVALGAGGRLGVRLLEPDRGVLTVQIDRVPSVWTLGEPVSFDVLAQWSPRPQEAGSAVLVAAYWSQDPGWSDDDVLLGETRQLFDESAPMKLDLQVDQNQEGLASLPAPLPGAGAGYLVVVGDPDGELPAMKMGGHVAAAPIYVTPAGGVDLKASFEDAPVSILAGGYKRVGVSVTNLGPGHMIDASGVSMYLSGDDRWHPDDLALDAAVLRGPMGDGQQQSFVLTAAVPEEAEGLMHLVLVADPGLAIDDPDRRNNIDIIPVVVDQSQWPDLVAEHLLAPPSLVLGQQAVAEYEVGNQGNAVAYPETGKSWSDRLYLSTDDQLSDDDVPLYEKTNELPLLPGDQYEIRRALLDVPEDLPEGAAYLILKTDADESVEEAGATENNIKAVAIEVMSKETAAEKLVDLGDPNNEPKKTVAWISLRDFEQLVARRSQLEQPSAQMVAEPDPDAPMRVATDDPARETTEPSEQPDIGQATAPPAGPPESSPENLPEEKPETAQEAVESQPSQTASSQSAEPEVTPDSASGTQALAGLDQPAVDSEGPVADASGSAVDEQQTSAEPGATVPEPDPTQASEDLKGPKEKEPVTETAQNEPTPSTEPTETADKQDPQAQDSQVGVDLPTSAPKADLESPPIVRIKQEIRLKPGSVVTGQGIRIRTVMPRISYVTYRLKTPERNPVVSITFNQAGKVVDAQLVRSSGEDAYDGPVLNSAWRYSAEGQEIQNLEGLLQVRIRILFVQEIEPATGEEEDETE